MTASRVLILQGHPDPTGRHFGHALADAYAESAQAAGHGVRRVEIAALDFPLLRSKAEWDGGMLPPALEPARDAIGWASHIVILFPLWLGDMPALLKAFLEQVARPGIALSRAEGGAFPKKLLGGRSARVVVTMGMPSAVYRWFFGAHAVKSLERNVLRFVGVAPVRCSYVGMVEAPDGRGRARWLRRMAGFGRAAR